MLAESGVRASNEVERGSLHPGTLREAFKQSNESARGDVENVLPGKVVMDLEEGREDVHGFSMSKIETLDMEYA